MVSGMEAVWYLVWRRYGSWYGGSTGTSGAVFLCGSCSGRARRTRATPPYTDSQQITADGAGLCLSSSWVLLRVCVCCSVYFDTNDSIIHFICFIFLL